MRINKWIQYRAGMLGFRVALAPTVTGELSRSSQVRFAAFGLAGGFHSHLSALIGSRRAALRAGM